MAEQSLPDVAHKPLCSAHMRRVRVHTLTAGLAFFTLANATDCYAETANAPLGDPPGPTSDQAASPPSSHSEGQAPPTMTAPVSPPGHAPVRTPGYTYVPPIEGVFPVQAPAPAGPTSQPAATLHADKFPEQSAERRANTHVDRVIVMPTAETHPQGSLYVSSYEIVVLQAGYALGPDTQLSLTLTPPFNQDNVALFDLSLKTVVMRERRAKLALIGSMTGITGLEEGVGAVGRAGAVFQGCFDDGCRSSANLGSTVLLLGPALLTASGLGVILDVSPGFDWLFETNVLLPLGRDTGHYNGLLAGTGARFSGQKWALDVTLMMPLDRENGIVALPFLAGTYRDLP